MYKRTNRTNPIVDCVIRENFYNVVSYNTEPIYRVIGNYKGFCSYFGIAYEILKHSVQCKVVSDGTNKLMFVLILY